MIKLILPVTHTSYLYGTSTQTDKQLTTHTTPINSRSLYRTNKLYTDTLTHLTVPCSLSQMHRLMPPLFLLQRKLELECRLEEEKMKTESEKRALEKKLVDLQTRIKHLTEHSRLY